MRQPFVLCWLEDTCYGVPALEIQQVELPGPLTRVPHADPDVDGVTSLRGAVVPVLNLRSRFGLQRAPVGRLVVVRHGERTVALAFDQAREFLEFEEDAVQPAGPDFPAHVSGVVQRPSGLVLLLSVDRLLQPATKETP